MTSRPLARKNRSARARGPTHLTPPDRLVKKLQVAIGEEVLSSIRHDVVNHVSAIANACFLVQNLAGDRADLARPLQTMRERVTATAELLGKTLATSQTPAERVDPRDVVQRLLADLSPIEIVTVSGPGTSATAPVSIAPDDLELALHCLVENGVEAAIAAGGGTVTVRCMVRPEQLVAIEVSDEGAGFSTESADHAFDPFFTTKPGRLGLGLPIARRIAYRWSGRVEISSGSSGGGRATLFLPMEGA